uniref:putative nuclease HARBI1 n=1 Tax=Myxine glutinosa TaxID=7769 RepID=UPI00358E87A6
MYCQQFLPIGQQQKMDQQALKPVLSIDEEEAFDIEEEALLLVAVGLCLKRKCEEEEGKAPEKKRKQYVKTVWVHNWLLEQQRPQHGWYGQLMEALEEGDLTTYKRLLRMDPDLFRVLVDRLTPRLLKQDTNMRKALPVGLKVALTLRFLASGDSYVTLACGFRVGTSTISHMIGEVCQAIYDEYHEELISCPTTPEGWKEVAKDFSDRWNFENCLGALDGKHVRITAPANTGSMYYNYKGHFSVVLLALVDARYRFRYIDVGANGSCSDAGLFIETSLRRALDQGNTGIPEPEPLPKDDMPMPYAIVGDDAFPLQPWLMKPYVLKEMRHKQRIFNYRLSRARRIVENAFGILANRFRCFHRPIEQKPETAVQIVLATCTLHNWLANRKQEKILRRADFENPDTHEVTPGAWRQEETFTALQRLKGNYGTKSAKDQRDYLADYYVSVGKVPWQDRMVCGKEQGPEHQTT